MLRGILHRLRLYLPFVRRDLAEQYSGSQLGLVWTFVQPALMVFLYWLVFDRIMRVHIPGDQLQSDIPFLAFLLSAFLPWLAFNEGVTKAAGSILARREVVKHLNFPLQVFPLAGVASAAAAHFAVFWVFLLVFDLWRGLAPGLHWLGVLLVMGLQLLMTGGLGLVLASFTLYLRDLTQVIWFTLTLCLYTTPILYPLAMVPEQYHAWMAWNPFFYFTESYHDLVLFHQWPDWSSLAKMALLSLTCLFIGRHTFRTLRDGFADVV